LKGFRRISYIILVIILLLNTFSAYADDELERLKREQQKIQQKLKEVLNEKNEKTKEYKDIVKDIKRLDSQLDKIDKEIQELENELNGLNENIEVTKLQLKEAQANIDEKNNIINKRLRVMYKNGTVGYIEVLLASRDLQDFLNRLDLVQRIISQDVELLKYLKEQKKTIEEKKNQLETQKEMVQNTKLNIEKKKQEIEIVSRAKESFMQSLKKDLKQLDRQEDELLKTAKEFERKIQREQLKRKYAGGKMTWPAPGYYRISSPFGMRLHPILKTRKMHTGVDIAVPYGRTIVAANDGVVKYADWYGGYGKVVWIDHGGGISTLYAHNSRLLVKKGQSVKKGQAIAKAGSTGYSTGPHLHFEVRKNGVYTNPMPWLRGN
jgi:murein DD-endopeptidase MepM/ murein hydrolase activator NlpD